MTFKHQLPGVFAAGYEQFLSKHGTEKPAPRWKTETSIPPVCINF